MRQRLALQVAQTAVQDFHLHVGERSETIEVVAAPSLIDRSISLGQVIDRHTLESIPLNGRKILQLALLVPGSVTPPQNAFLAAPSRAQGSQGLNTAGHREDTNNVQLNGVTLNDQINNILIFQPPLDALQEFRIDNATPSVEHGRNSGASIDIVTRSGTNQWKGGLGESFRHRSLDARNVFDAGSETPFERHEFGGFIGGPLTRNRSFFFAVYEGLRQQQGLPVNSVVLSESQRAGITHPIMKRVIDLLPHATGTDARGVDRFVGWADAPVDVDQASLDLTVEHTHAVGTPRVHQTRAGFSRIAFDARASAALNPADFGIDVGHTRASGLPVFNVAGAFTLGGPTNFPQDRTDTTVLVSHIMSVTPGRHAIKIGAEYRQFTYDTTTLDSGTFNFPSIAAFINGVANSFTVRLGDRAARIVQRSVGGFLQDDVQLHRTVTVDLGVRYEWNVTPSEQEDRLVVFEPATASLLRIGVDKRSRECRSATSPRWKAQDAHGIARSGRLSPDGSHTICSSAARTPGPRHATRTP